ncbi:four helix bundle protein [Sediminibacterium sp.]|uniref:four helix bundle protein n=1 Tax=Sediminibacterium sp. TaxID=1917865 RepID=UPI002724EB57|nr:four helix bundle protein [Sediminibacterium sp.]MDO9000540.1 four helix bundle protein [Bacteroidota bacterium]MDP3146892.1 four helix bundle protein [Bacteroidota bacterium]MDP3567569.1 four helix bundle protein [Sediminibacterium sp.]
MKTSTYKDLIVWQKAIILVTNIYKLTNSFPSEERFGLASQLNRAAVSIPSNIAEGWGRELPKNYLQFLRVSRGSLMEVETMILISKNLNFISEKEYLEINTNIEEVGKILQGLIKSVQQKTKLIQEVQPLS